MTDMETGELPWEDRGGATANTPVAAGSWETDPHEGDEEGKTHLPK